jgi:predicted site-specific integrase-resolvase
MTSETSWYTLEKAAEKYCLETSRILNWVDEGLIRSELPDTRSMRIKAEDLDRKMQYEKKCELSFRDCD